MITAQDIREKCFEKARIGGYAMDEVDDFLDELANDAAASQKEIATLNAKMKYLADKIREYQGSEEAMNMALVSAQKLAKNIEEDARAKAEALVARRKPTISSPPPRPSLTAPSARSRPTARPRSCATRRRAPPPRNTSRRSACCSTASRPSLPRSPRPTSPAPS